LLRHKEIEVFQKEREQGKQLASSDGPHLFEAAPRQSNALLAFLDSWTELPASLLISFRFG